MSPTMTKLQVYQDLSVASSLGSAEDSHVTPRKAVSFSNGTKTPGEGGGAAHRTPFRRHNHQSPGVTPNPGKSPKMTVGSFRQSLKTPTPSRGQRQVFGDRDAKENARNRHQPRQEPKVFKSKLNTPQASKVSTMRNDGRQAAPKTTTTTPTSASAIRRSLRATIVPEHQPRNQLETRQTKPLFVLDETESQENPRKPEARPAEKSRLLSKTMSLSSTTAGGLRKFGPPQRVVPKTPNSLLRSELEIMDSSSSFGSPGDDSLLLSPPPGAVWNSLNVSGNHSVAASTGLVILSPQAAEQVHAWSTAKKDRSTEENDVKTVDNDDDE